jgi:hypothetical protein
LIHLKLVVKTINNCTAKFYGKKYQFLAQSIKKGGRMKSLRIILELVIEVIKNLSNQKWIRISVQGYLLSIYIITVILMETIIIGYLALKAVH